MPERKLQKKIRISTADSGKGGIGTLFRMWGQLWKDNHLLKDTVVENDRNDSRTHKVFQALEEICYEFDLGKPIWLSSNVSEFQRHSKTRFRKDSFIEEVPFDYLEIQILEEDD